jgi:hypothetical protein
MGISYLYYCKLAKNRFVKIKKYEFDTDMEIRIEKLKE